MNTLFLILAFNISVEVLRVYDPSYYTVKEVKIKKLECIKQFHVSGNERKIK